MRKAYASVKTAKFTLTSSFDDRLGKAKVVTGNFVYARPGKLNAKISGLTVRTHLIYVVVSDGKKIKTSIGKVQPSVGAYSAENLTAEFGYANLETICFWDYAKQLSTAPGGNMHSSALKILGSKTMDGRKFIVLEERSAAEKVVANYWVDPANYLIYRTVVKPLSGAGKGVDCRLRSLKLSATPPDPRLFGTR